MSAPIVTTVLSVEEAHLLTDEIKGAGGHYWELIQQAWDGRVWLGMNYPDWDTYCRVEFKDARMKLPLEERRDVLASMRESGMSIRAVASATGSSTRTVQKTLAAAGVVSDHTCDSTFVESPTSTVVDGRSGPKTDVQPIPKASTRPDPAPKPTIGLDGKTYPARPTPVVPEDDGSLRAARQRLAFETAMQKATHSVVGFQSDDVAAFANEDTWTSIEKFEQFAHDWAKRMQQHRPPSGLRIVGGQA